jgi:site-specific recombinase XerD
MLGMDPQNLLIWREFERDLRTAKRSPRTIQSYEEAATQLAAFVAGQWCTGCEHATHDGAAFEDMTKAHVTDYLLTVLDRHSTSTAGVRFRSLRAFFNWMVAEEIRDASPMARMTEPTPDEVPVDVPPAEHVRALLATCETKTTDARRKFNNLRDAAIIRLFCEAGAPRVAEMAGIETARVDMASDVVSFLGKGRKWRSVPFGAKTGKALSKYLRARPKHPLVVEARAKDPKSDGPDRLWLGWRGKPLDASGIYQMIERRCEEAGIGRIHPHQLRHFAVDAWYEDGGSVQDAMTLFGWSSPAMAHHYAKATAGKRAINAARRASIGDQL